MRWVERIASQHHCCFCFIFYQKLYHLRAPFFSPSFTHLCNVQTASKQNTIQFCLIEDRSCSSVLWCAWMGGQVFNYNSVCVNYLLVFPIDILADFLVVPPMVFWGFLYLWFDVHLQFSHTYDVFLWLGKLSIYDFTGCWGKNDRIRTTWCLHYQSEEG